MNPQACFNLLLESLADKDYTAAFDHLDDMWNWLMHNGFPPTIPARTYISIGNEKGTAYSILSHPGGFGAEFIRYAFDSISGRAKQTHRFMLN